MSTVSLHNCLTFLLFGTLYGKSSFPLPLPGKMHKSFLPAHTVFSGKYYRPADPLFPRHDSQKTKETPAALHIQFTLHTDCRGSQLFLPDGTVHESLCIYSVVFPVTRPVFRRPAGHSEIFRFAVSEMKSIHPRPQIFHREAVSHCEAVFHKSQRDLFRCKEKNFVLRQRLFLWWSG